MAMPINPTAPNFDGSPKSPIAIPKQTNQILTPEQMAAGLLQIPSVLEEKEITREKILLYGEPFSGKTTLAALLSEFYYLLWLDGDNGIAAIQNNLHPEMQKRIIPIRIPANSSAPIFLHTVLKIITGNQVKICTKHGAISCMLCTKPDSQHVTVALNQLPKNWITVIDNLSSFTQCSITHAIMKATGKQDTPDDYKLEFDDWGRVKNHMDKLGPYIKDGRFDLVCIAHQTVAKAEGPTQEIKESKDNMRIFPLVGSDKTAVNFAKNFGHEVYAKIHNNRHTYYSASNASTQFQTGSRSNVALENCKIPSLLHFMKPKEADKLLEGSWSEWYLTGKKGIQPQPKGVLPL